MQGAILPLKFSQMHFLLRQKKKHLLSWTFCASGIWLLTIFYIYKYMEHTENKYILTGKGLGCKLRQLDPFNEEMMKFVEKTPKIVCFRKDWVKCWFSVCSVVPELLEYVKDDNHALKCKYRDIIYKSDKYYTIGPPTILRGNKKYHLNKSDHVEIKCTVRDLSNGILKTRHWTGHGIGFRPVKVINPPETQKNELNVLIFGFDSASKNGFIRKLPKTYQYLKNVINAVVLNGYNIVGDGTPAALFPILTGKTEPELPYCVKNQNNSGYLDDTKPFIFHKVKKYGYRTAYFEDMPHIGTFQYRFNGFRYLPADHYLRAFYLEADKLGKKNREFYCIGETPRFKLMMNITNQFLLLNGKKFIFTFVADIAHNDFNLVQNADEPFVDFLERLLTNGLLEDTLLVVMGDHGPRYANLRNTDQGRLEERLPFMAIRLPEDLTSIRPDALNNLKQNVNVLTTPHDIYATVLDVIDMREHWNHFKVKGADLTRGMTLLETIPKTRSCVEAGLSPYWCACSQWKVVYPDHHLYNRTAQALVDHINDWTQFLRSKCALRTLKSVEWEMSMKIDTSEYPDDYVDDVVVYQVKLSVGPGQGDFEAAVTYHINENKFHVNSEEVSRTNGYNNEPDCISAKFPRLNPYCYCLPLET